jgi:putative glutamine amidotransferase
MPPRIAIPLPHSANPDYCARALPQYERAVTMAGGEAVPISFDLAEAVQLIQSCDGVLLPGSNADIDPSRFAAARSPHAAPADPLRDALDTLLLEDAYRARKPILGICYGLQSINVHCSGSLIQHIPDFLPEATRTKVNHEAGRDVPVAHIVEVEEDSKLAEILSALRGDSRPRLSGRAQLAASAVAPEESREEESREGHGLSRADRLDSTKRALAPEESQLVLPVNSSHHQSAENIGDGLRIVARCPDDGIIEALEGTDPDHFVLAVQWHPERSVNLDGPSRAIFRALVEAAKLARK